MKSLLEKISFIVTGLIYFLFHLRLGHTPGETTLETAAQLLGTFPYAAGFTYLTLLFIRYTANDQWPPWDRIARIFFTIGMVFGLLFALYERNDRAQKNVSLNSPVSIEAPISEHDTPKTP
ncbi:MAG: hypothetical protein OEM02_12190 [Desulfobulbaceae bacterium]|nr:hypothetical protein [Desulfobulbaceae bacterium]